MIRSWCLSLVNALFADADVQLIHALSTHSEPLQICYPKEVNVSRFLAWLIDPGQGYELGDQALKSLLTRAGLCSESAMITLNDRRFLTEANVHFLAFTSLIVMVEAELGLPNETRYIDVLAVDPAAKLYVAMENKFGMQVKYEFLGKTRTFQEVNIASKNDVIFDPEYLTGVYAEQPPVNSFVEAFMEKEFPNLSGL